MDKNDIIEGAMYSVISSFEFDGETFESDDEFKVLKIVTHASDIAYISTEWKRLLVHGHDGEGLGKEKHCWDIDQDYIVANCKLITAHAKAKEEPGIVLKRFTKKEFLEVLKAIA